MEVENTIRPSVNRPDWKIQLDKQRKLLLNNMLKITDPTRSAEQLSEYLGYNCESYLQIDWILATLRKEEAQLLF